MESHKVLYLFRDGISLNLKELTNGNIIHVHEVMINELDYHNKIDVNNLVDR